MSPALRFPKSPGERDTIFSPYSNKIHSFQQGHLSAGECRSEPGIRALNKFTIQMSYFTASIIHCPPFWIIDSFELNVYTFCFFIYRRRPVFRRRLQLGDECLELLWSLGIPGNRRGNTKCDLPRCIIDLVEFCGASDRCRIIYIFEIWLVFEFLINVVEIMRKMYYCYQKCQLYYICIVIEDEIYNCRNIDRKMFEKYLLNDFDQYM